MSGEDLKSLADRAESIRGRADQRLAEVHARIRSTRRRRAGAAVAGAAAAVLALVIGIAALTGPTGAHKTDGPPPPAASPTKTAAPAAPSSRRIVYGEGWPIRKFHAGDQIVDIGDLVPSGSFTPVYLNTTDGGVVFTVDDDRSRVRFTAGKDIVTIGQIGVYTHIGSSRVVTGTSGSLAAWPDVSGGSVQLVVYDTAERVEVRRFDCPKCGSPEIVGDHVYWARNENVRSALTTMFDAASGETTHVSAKAYVEDQAAHARGLVTRDSTGTDRVSNGVGQVFRSDGRRLWPVLDLGPASPGVTHWGRTRVSDTGSGRPLELRLPAGFAPQLLFTVFDWLDDDRLALVQDDGVPGSSGGDGKILVCRVSTQQCQVAVPPTGDSRWVANLDFP